MGHDELKRYSLLDITDQCPYVLQLAIINSNLCFCYLNISKATVKLLSLYVDCVTLKISMINDIVFKSFFLLRHYPHQCTSNIINILAILMFFCSPSLRSNSVKVLAKIDVATIYFPTDSIQKLLFAFCTCARCYV